YVQAVVDDFSIPGEDLAIRAELEAATRESGGLRDAWAGLCRPDPAAAARLDEHNQRPIARGLAGSRAAGRPCAVFGPGGVRAESDALAALHCGVWRSRGEVGARIEARLDQMRAEGLEAEVATLPHELSRTAAQAIGYQELLAARRGELTVDDAFALAARR